MRNSINSRKLSNGETLWSFFLPFSFLIVQYGYGFGNPMITYCFLFAAYCVIRFLEFPIFKPLSVYTFWYVTVLLGTVVIYGHEVNRAYIMHLMQIIVCGYCVTIIAKHLDLEALYKCWKVLGLITCAVVAFQFFETYVLHHTVTPVRLLPVSEEAIKLNKNWSESSFRPLAFFTEPSMVVSFLAPVLLLAQQKKEVIVSIVVSIAILLSGSTSGVVALAIMWGLSIFSYKLSKTSKLIIIILSIATVFAFVNLPYFRDSLDKIYYEMSGDSSNMAVRMLRGWWIYATLDTRSQLLGISNYDIASVVYDEASEFTWQNGYEDNFYLNTAQRVLIQTGVVGAILYIFMLIRLWMSTKKVVKPYLAFVIVSMLFGSEFYISGLFVMQFILLLAYLTKFDEKDEAKDKLKKRGYYAQEVHQ